MPTYRDRAALDNPDLPASFIAESLMSLAEPREDSTPFVPRSVAVTASFDWYEDRAPQTPWTDTVIYETHVRGISMRHPDVPENLRGTYAGLATAFGYSLLGSAVYVRVVTASGTSGSRQSDSMSE